MSRNRKSTKPTIVEPETKSAPECKVPRTVEPKPKTPKVSAKAHMGEGPADCKYKTRIVIEAFTNTIPEAKAVGATFHALTGAFHASTGVQCSLRAEIYTDDENETEEPDEEPKVETKRAFSPLN